MPAFRHGRTIIVAVHAVEHEPQPLLVSLQVLGELLEVQQTVVVDVALEDDLRGGSKLQRQSGLGAGEEGFKTDGAGRDGKRTFWFFFWYDKVRYLVMRMAWRGGQSSVGGRGSGGGGCVQRECDRYTGERRRGQNVRRCAPCESQEGNQILPGCTHYLSSLEKGQREKERQRIQD